MARDLYKKSGVDVDKGEELVKWLETPSEETSTKKDLNDFSASFEPNFSSYKTPLLISSTDGVGTKLLLALEQKKLDGLGFDLVGMCVNDLYTSGAKPLFFLDYFATAKLSDDQFKTVLSSIQAALNEIPCPLLGGETAELPGIYQDGHFDLAGFVVGSVDKEKRMHPKNTQEGDLLYALSSSGFHSNGYTLLRKFLKEKPELQTEELVTNLLKPTVVYSKIPELFNQLGPNAMHSACHVTGGGITGNLNRILSEDLQAKVSFKSLKTPTWMENFLSHFSDSLIDFASVFNMGVGMVLSVNKESKELFEKEASKLKLSPYLIGEICKKAPDDPQVSLV